MWIAVLGRDWVHKTTRLNQSSFIEVLEPSQETKRSCVRVGIFLILG